MTSELKHTQRPWTCDPQDTHFSFCGPEARPLEEPDYDFRIEFSDHVSTVEQAATANLIVAAPELYEALKHLVHWHDQLSSKDIEMAQAAIAKAEGRAQPV